MLTNGFSARPLKVKLLAEEQKATEMGIVGILGMMGIMGVMGIMGIVGVNNFGLSPRSLAGTPR